MEIKRSQSDQSQNPRNKNSRNPTKRRKIREGLDHSNVEVCGKDVGKVGRNKIMVEYKTLVSEDDEQRPLSEAVEVSDVRPVPPVVPVSGFEVLEKVDAFDNDGWWVGRISGRCDDGRRYFVYFESSGDEIAYPIHRIRVHQEWEDGQWLVV